MSYRKSLKLDTDEEDTRWKMKGGPHKQKVKERICEVCEGYGYLYHNKDEECSHCAGLGVMYD